MTFLAAHYLAAIYGSLALAALCFAWHDRNQRAVAVMLAVDYVVSNISCALGPIENRPGIYTMLEIMVIISCYMANLFAEEAVTRRLMRAVAIFSLISICANVAFASISDPIVGQAYIYVVATNLCFAAECSLVIAGGMIDGLGIHGFGDWLGRWRAHARPYVHTRNKR